MKVWEKAKIRNILIRSNEAVEKGIVAIFERQTADEQRAQTARYNNSIGFSAAHASRGSYYAKWVKGGRKLSGNHVLEGRKLILHYVRQLVEISNENEQAKNSCAVDGCGQPRARQGDAYCIACGDAWEDDAQTTEFNDFEYGCAMVGRNPY